MAFFGFGKKKEEAPCCGGQEIKSTCACGSQCGVSSSDILPPPNA